MMLTLIELKDNEIERLKNVEEQLNKQIQNLND
jgi:predicted transglutaminase-like cysteine proteinase